MANGIPPPNDDGKIRNPNPDPTPPPSSAIKVTPNSSESLDQFYDRFKQLNKMLDESKAVIEKQVALDKEANKARVVADKAQKKLIDGTAKLEKQMAKYRDENGQFRADAQKQKEKYEAQMASLKKANEEAEEAFKKASAAASNNSVGIADEIRERKNSIEVLRELKTKLSTLPADLRGDLEKDFSKISSTVEEQSKKVEESEKKRQEVLDSASQRKIDSEAAAEKKSLDDKAKTDKAAAEQKKQEEKEKSEEEKKRETLAQKLKEENDKQKSKEVADRILKSGGIVGLTDIQAKIASIVDKQVLEFQAKNPNATDEDVQKKTQEILQNIKSQEIAQMLSGDLSSVLTKIQKEETERIMKEKQVSREDAQFFLQTDETAKERIQEAKTQHEEMIKEVTAMKDAQLQEIYYLQDKDAKDAETKMEQQNAIPRWAAVMIDQQKKYGDLFKMSNIKSDGFFKTLIFLLVMVVGATLGYIWYKLKMIFSIVKAIPFGIGKAISGLFGKLGLAKMGTNIGGMFSNLVKPLQPLFSGIKAVMALFPGITGFFGKFMSAFMFGFRILGKVFFWVGLTIDVLMGAFKGFKEMGNIKGIILGIVAGIVRFFTFGLIDFETIFDTLKVTLGVIIDVVSMVVQPLIDGAKQMFGIFKEFFAKIRSIWSGTGSLTEKISKTIIAAVKAQVQNMVILIKSYMMYFVNLFIKLPVHIAKLAVILIKGVADGVRRFVEWVKSAEGKAELKKFVTELRHEMKMAFKEMLAVREELKQFVIDQSREFILYLFDTVMNAMRTFNPVLRMLPESNLAGEYRKNLETIEKFKTSTTDEKISRKQVNKFEIVGISENGFPIYGNSIRANVVRQAASSVSATKQAMQSGGGTVIVNTPTTNNVSSGGGGQNITVLPTSSRNTERSLAMPFGTTPFALPLNLLFG